MNKKGFTLIEVIVSIVLVSVVLVSLMATLIKLRETYSVIHENSDVLVYASSISRVINNDIMDNNGIRYASCDMNGVTCDITLGNDQKRRLEIIEEEINHGRIKRTDKKEANHVTKNSTLKYSDTTKEEKAEDGTIDTSKNKIIYIRTLALEDYTEIIKENGREIEGVHTTEGYNFYSITSDTSEIKKIKNNEIFVDVVTKLIVNIYDGIDVNDTKYNVTLYSAGKYSESEYIGKRYTIEFDLNGAETSSGDYSMDEVFGVGYYKTGEKAVLKNKITKIKIPKRSNQAFLGYYYSNGEVQVVDGIGNIVASNMLFKNDVLLGPEAKERVYAKWGPCEAPGYKVVEGGCSPNEFTMTLNANGGKFGDGNDINVYTKVAYQSKLPNLRTKPQRAGYGFEGFSYNGKKYYDNTGNQVSIYDIDHNETLNAGWHICAERTYSTAEMLSCEPCPLTYTSGAGAKSKSECYLDVGPGKELPNINTDYIKSCDAGHYNNTNERVYFGKNKTCSQCAAGYYQPNSGATSCIKCAAGYTSGRGAKECSSRIYTITLNNNGATSAGTKTIYMKYNTGWYSNVGATTTMSIITVPTKTGYTFEGYYTEKSGGTQIIDSSGAILSGNTTIFNDTSNKGTLYVRWKVICKDNEYFYEGNCHALAKEWTTPGQYDYEIPKSGYYKLEAWGAQGGYGEWGKNRYRTGGLGGYTAGEKYFTVGTMLNIYVGGSGSNGYNNKGGLGGYNGGGTGGSSSGVEFNAAGGGGGASDIRINGIAYSNRIIVAGGGGGGNGGGYEVPDGLSGNYYYDKNNSSNTLGIGSDGSNGSGGGGGGGGGYYGGKAGYYRKNVIDPQKAYGGTYYFSNDFLNIIVNPDSKEGNGKIKLTYIGSTPSISNKNESYTTPGIYMYTVPVTGNYNIELWGASGGGGLWGSRFNHSGGKGGYTKGTIHLSKNTNLFVFVGGTGGNGYGRNGGKEGFNGGGKGGFCSDPGSGTIIDNNGSPGGGGGGASDIRLNGVNYNNRIIVAGGGSGGTGGGGEAPNGLPGNKYSGSTNSSGNLGVGGNGISTSGGPGGGGGGFYGGKSEQRNVGQGYGGTYYISNSFSNTEIGVGYKSGNGQVKITFLGL